MTELRVEEVADALVALLLRQQGEDSPNPENWDSGYAAHLANFLAPRVAAAIEAGRFNCGSDQYDDFDREEGNRDALAALRN